MPTHDKTAKLVGLDAYKENKEYYSRIIYSNILVNELRSMILITDYYKASVEFKPKII